MFEFPFPDVGEGLTEATLVAWKVQPGDTVEEDQTIAEVETDKAVVDIPIPVAGTVKEVKADEGATITVGDIILTLENTEGEPEPTTEQEQAKQEQTQKSSPATPQRSHRQSGILAMPRVKHEARKQGIDLATVTGSGPNERILLADLNGAEHTQHKTETRQAQKPSKKQKKQPTATTNQTQRFSDYQPQNITFTGPPSTRGEQPAPRTTTSQRQTAEATQEAFNGMRKAIAENMQRSLNRSAQVTLTEEADVQRIYEYREAVKDDYDTKITYLSFIAKAATQALKHHEYMNTTSRDETITKHPYVNLGIAVDLGDGLIVPNIKRAEQKSILELARSIADLAEQARNHELTKEHTENGTFTITSLGSIGGETFTPILNPPETGILGVGRIKNRPRVHNAKITARHIIHLSLTFDHRVVDGAYAAKYLQTLKHMLEHPEKLLVEL